MQLVDGVFFSLGNLIRAVVDRVHGVDVVFAGVDVGSVVDKVDGLVAIAAESVCELVKARVEGILLVLHLFERIGCRLHVAC